LTYSFLFEKLLTSGRLKFAPANPANPFGAARHAIPNSLLAPYYRILRVWRRSISLPAYLFILLFCTVTPIAFFAAALISYVAKDERNIVESDLRDRTRALTIALDLEFQSSIAALNVLATSRLLDSANFSDFYALCKLARTTQPAWKAIALNDYSGAPIFNLLVPFGTALPPAGGESLAKVLQTKKPVILQLIKGSLAGWAFGVSVPVFRGGQVKYALTAIIEPSRLAAIMRRQELPSSWVGTIVDQHNRVVARSRSPEEFIGQEATIIKDVPLNATEGSLRGYNLSGEPSYSVFRRSPFSGWYVVMNVPAEFLDAPVRRSLAYVIGAGLFALLFGTVFAIFIAKRINDSVRSIRNLAQSIGLGKKINDVERSPISELNSITDALHDASNLLQESAAKRRRAEEELREANNQLEQRVHTRTVALYEEVQKKQAAEESIRSQALLLQLTHDAIIVRAYNDGRIQFWNRGATLIYGWSEAEAVGKVIHELLQSRYPEPVQQILEKVARDDRWEGEVVQKRKDGTEIILHSRWSLRRDSDGRPVDILELSSDITPRKYAEQRAQENEWLASLGTASAMFAHEIANPLDGISSSLQLLESELNRKPDTDIRLRRILDISTEEIERLGSLVNEFRILARPQVVNLRPATLVDLVNDVLVPQIAVCRNAGIAVKREFGDLQPVLLDRDKMKQVILNLCKNAIEAMPQGGVLTLRAFQSQDKAVLEITDTGVGIPQEMDVFQLFTTTKPAGSGLGLPVVRQIIAAHHGHIEYTSEIGHGTTFRIYLRACL